MSYPLVMAKKNSYGGTRSLASIKFIVLHYTGNHGDIAMDNARFFASGNTRSAGAHFFADQDGSVVQSIPLKYIAWSVGDWRNGKGTHYAYCTNSNSVSIEMCDQLNKDASEKQIAAVRELIAYIKSQCPGIVDVIRHYDVTTKHCPARYLSNSKWHALKAAVTGGTYTAPEKDDPVPLAVDGYVGTKTVEAWQRIMGTPVDGEISGQIHSLSKYHLRFTSSALSYKSAKGSALIKAVQKQLDCDPDGLLGPDTIKAIQKHVGVYPDGYFGEQTAKALQERLNTGKF